MASPTGNPYIDALAGQSWIDLGYGSDFRFFLSDRHLPWDISSRVAFIEVVRTWAAVANITFTQVPDSPTAQFVEYVTTLDHLASIAPDPAAIAMHNYPRNEGAFGYFAIVPSWTPGGLARGGYSFETILHELGHGLGLDHPYEPEPFPGVDGPADLGDLQLNQNIYTVMSYIRPHEPSRDDPQHDNYGYVATPMALDIAAIQHLYGANLTTRPGDDVYVLPGVNQPGTFWSCIWDVGGIDEIRYDGAIGAILDLRAATLDGTYMTGGLISMVNGVHGGFTIANAVVIENARGGAGNDTLMGNAADNTLAGSGGSDTFDGGLGYDRLEGGAGDDVFVLTDVQYRLVQGPIFSFYDTVYDQIVEVAAGGYDTVRVARAADGSRERTAFSLPANVEAGEILGDATFTLTGNSLDNKLVGNSGKNTLDGGIGVDILNGGGDYDTLVGGTDDDTYVLADVTRVFLAGIGFRNLYDVVSEDAGGGTDEVRVSPLAGPLNATFYALTEHVENGAVVGSGNFILHGNELSNRLVGNSESNTFTGGSGNDVLNGAGGFDTAGYAGPHGNYQVHTFTAPGGVATRVKDGVASEGNDFLVGIETLAFADGNVTSFTAQQNLTANVDGQRFDDVIFRSVSNGQVIFKNMTAGTAGVFDAITAPLTSAWRAIGTGDVNTDAKADVFVWNSGNGQVLVASPGGSGTPAWSVLANGINGAYAALDVTDVNGDGFTDVLVRHNPSGTIYWQNSAAPAQWGVVSINLGAAWSFRGAGDVNGDGFADVVIQNSSGLVYAANMANGVNSGYIDLGNIAGHAVRTVADVNGDGFADVIVQNTTNGQTLWRDLSGSGTTWKVASDPVGAGWIVRNGADVNNDGSVDLIYQHAATGETIYRAMDNGVATGWRAVSTPLGTEWVVV